MRAENSPVLIQELNRRQKRFWSVALTNASTVFVCGLLVIVLCRWRFGRSPWLIGMALLLFICIIGAVYLVYQSEMRCPICNSVLLSMSPLSCIRCDCYFGEAPALSPGPKASVRSPDRRLYQLLTLFSGVVATYFVIGVFIFYLSHISERMVFLNASETKLIAGTAIFGAGYFYWDRQANQCPFCDTWNFAWAREGYQCINCRRMPTPCRFLTVLESLYWRLVIAILTGLALFFVAKSLSK